MDLGQPQFRHMYNPAGTLAAENCMAVTTKIVSRFESLASARG